LAKKIIVIGSGFAGLSAASFMAKAGWDVTVIEKNASPGGRARQLKEDGFIFDMGPSWYWMPDVFERYFGLFGKRVEDYYQLKRLKPSYRVYWNDDFTDIPSSYEDLRSVFEKLEPGSAARLDRYLSEAAYKYEAGIKNLVHKPGLSVTEFFDWDVIRGVFKLDVFISIQKHVRKYFSNSRLRLLMEFPVLFLGALPEDTPALYSLMNYADIKLGTWYPQSLSRQGGSGMYAVVDGMYQLATELGVQFHFGEAVKGILVGRDGYAKTITTDKDIYRADVVISGADYHFTEKNLLPPEFRSYTESYWNKRVMAPSCLLYYVGLNKKLKQAVHHSLFFDVSFDQHSNEIYKDPQWPSEPLFYVSVSSVTDEMAAPAGCENLVFLIPVAAGLEGDTEELREKYFQMIVKRMEKHTGETILDSVVYKKTYSVSDFVHDYNSFRGNAYGLANTLRQTAIFRPSCRSRKVKNLFYAGQLTVPGPGVPPCLISGEVAAKQVLKAFG
jgi:phytoene desaturase